MKRSKVWVVALIILSSSFAVLNITTQPSFAYTWQQEPTTNVKIWANNNSTPTSFYSDYGVGYNVWDVYNRTSLDVTLHNYTYNGTVNFRINAQLYSYAGFAGPGGGGDSNVGTVWVNLRILNA